MKRLDLIVGFLLTACLASVGLAQTPDITDRRPFYVIAFLSGGDTPPPLANCRPEWRADPSWAFAEMERGWSFGFRKFLWHMPQGTGPQTFTAEVWTLLPALHQKAIAEGVPAWLAEHAGSSVWVYTGFLTATNATISPTTKAGSPYLASGLGPLLRIGFDGVAFDAAERTKALPVVQSLRSWGHDGAYEPLPVQANADGTFSIKSKAWYDMRTFTWDSLLVMRTDRYGGSAPNEWLGLDPLGKFRFIGADRRPYGFNGVVLTAAYLPHTNAGRGSLDVPKAKAIADDYLARGWIVDCGMGGYPEHDEVARYIAAKQGATP